MNRLIMVICILLLTAVVVGFIACNHPRGSIDSQGRLEKIGTSTIHRAGAIEYAKWPLTAPAVIGRVMYSMDGQIIGVLFSTPKGDFCESRDGTPAGFIALKEKRQPPL
jgi:hypothetical protein